MTAKIETACERREERGAAEAKSAESKFKIRKSKLFSRCLKSTYLLSQANLDLRQIEAAELGSCLIEQQVITAE